MDGQSGERLRSGGNKQNHRLRATFPLLELFCLFLVHFPSDRTWYDGLLVRCWSAISLMADSSLIPPNSWISQVIAFLTWLGETD